jgi:hypothetical protein
VKHYASTVTNVLRLREELGPEASVCRGRMALRFLQVYRRGEAHGTCVHLFYRFRVECFLYTSEGSIFFPANTVDLENRFACHNSIISTYDDFRSSSASAPFSLLLPHHR